MATLTDPRIIVWSDHRARVLADDLVQLYAKLLAYQTDWAAQGINALIVAGGNTNIVADSSVTGPDGRQQVTGLMIQNLISCINQIVTAMGTTNVTGVGSPPMTTANLLQVNGSVR